MQKEIENLIQKAKADYIKFACAGERGMPKEGSYFASEIANFEDSFEIKEGKKYIKLVRKNGGVWGFIVKEDGPKFKKGDILKAAGFNAPATNAARGNIFEEYSVAWTGPHYLV